MLGCIHDPVTQRIAVQVRSRKGHGAQGVSSSVVTPWSSATGAWGTASTWIVDRGQVAVRLTVVRPQT